MTDTSTIYRKSIIDMLLGRQGTPMAPEAPTLSQGPAPQFRNEMADYARGAGLNALSDRFNDPMSGAGIIADYGVGPIVNGVRAAARTGERMFTGWKPDEQQQVIGDAFSATGLVGAGGLSAPAVEGAGVGAFSRNKPMQATEENARKMFAKGMTTDEIAEALRMSPDGFKRWMNRDFNRKPPGRVEATPEVLSQVVDLMRKGRSQAQVGEFLGISQSAVGRMIRNNQEHFRDIAPMQRVQVPRRNSDMPAAPATRDHDVVDLLRQGLGYEEIAARLSMPLNDVTRILRERFAPQKRSDALIEMLGAPHAA